MAKKKTKPYFQSNPPSKIEITVSKWLKEHEINYIYNARFKDCINPLTKQKLIFDFWIPELNLIIELDGEQHERFIRKMHRTIERFKKYQAKDKVKDNYCIQKKINLIRIPQKDFNNINEILKSIIDNG